MNTLIVHANASARAVIRAVLERMEGGVKLYEFTSAPDALTWCEAGRADFVLVGYLMPAMDGLEFTRRFFASTKHADVPVMLVTVMQNDELAALAREAGVVDVVVMPFRPRDLYQRCQNLMNLRRRTEQRRQDLSRQYHGMAALIAAQTSGVKGGTGNSNS